MLILVVVYNSVLLISLIQEMHTDFNDLGKLMLGGVVGALVIAVAFTLVRMRMRDKNPPASDFISINTQRCRSNNSKTS